MPNTGKGEHWGKQMMTVHSATFWFWFQPDVLLEDFSLHNVKGIQVFSYNLTSDLNQESDCIFAFYFDSKDKS